MFLSHPSQTKPCLGTRTGTRRCNGAQTTSGFPQSGPYRCDPWFSVSLEVMAASNDCLMPEGTGITWQSCVWLQHLPARAADTFPQWEHAGGTDVLPAPANTPFVCSASTSLTSFLLLPTKTVALSLLFNPVWDRCLPALLL